MYVTRIRGGSRMARDLHAFLSARQRVRQGGVPMSEARQSASQGAQLKSEKARSTGVTVRSHTAGQIIARGRSLAFQYDLSTGHWILHSIAPGPSWQCGGTGRVRLIDPEGQIRERDVASAALVSCREEWREQGRARCFQIQRCWPDGLAVCQQFIFWPDGTELEAELSIRPPRNFRFALRSLSPLAPPVRSMPNVSLEATPELATPPRRRIRPPDPPWSRPGSQAEPDRGCDTGDLAAGPSRAAETMQDGASPGNGREYLALRLLDLGWSTAEPATVLRLPQGTEVTATGLAALGDEEGRACVTFGFLDGARSVGEYRAVAFTDTHVGLQASAEFGTIDLAPSGATSGSLWLSAAPIEQSLPGFVSVWRARHPRRDRRGALVQWQPANGQHGPSSEAQFLDRLAAASVWPGALALDVVTLGLDWSTVPGDWTPDPLRFPHGLRALRDATRGQDLRAGIRLAPFLVARSSSTFQQHPGWVVRSPEGDPVVVEESEPDVFALDLSQPSVVDWIGAVGRQIHDEWGFDLIQADHLDQSVVSGWHASDKVSAIEAYRRGLIGFQQSLAGAPLIAADAPLFASLDLVDGVLSGSGTLRRADPSALLRASLSGIGALIGPSPISLSLDGQTIDEARAAATIACFGGGLVTLVGDPGAFPPECTEIWRSCVPPYWERPLVPITPFAPDGPTLFGGHIGEAADDYFLLVILNPTSVPVARVVPLAVLGLTNGCYHAFEFWTQSYLGALSERIAIDRIPAGGCAVVGLRPVRDEPQVVGTSLHVTLGAVALQSVSFDRRACRLHLVVGATGERHGTITVALPRGWTPGPIRGTGGAFGVRLMAPMLAEIECEFKDVADLELEFWPQGALAQAAARA